MTERAALGSLTNGTGLGIYTIRVNPAVTERVAFSRLTNGTGFGRCAGRIRPSVVAKLSVFLATDLAYSLC